MPHTRPGLHGQELARHARLGDLRLDLVGHPIELPPHRRGNHRNRLGQPDVAHRLLLHPRRELFAREARPDLLLKRQPADARILDAVDGDPVDALADAGERDGEGVHDEAGVHAGAEHRDLWPSSPRHRWRRQPTLVVPRVGELLGGRDDRASSPGGSSRSVARPPFNAELVHSRTTSGAVAFERGAQVGVDASPAASDRARRPRRRRGRTLPDRCPPRRQSAALAARPPGGRCRRRLARAQRARREQA